MFGAREFHIIESLVCIWGEGVPHQFGAIPSALDIAFICLRAIVFGVVFFENNSCGVLTRPIAKEKKSSTFLRRRGGFLSRRYPFP